MTTFLLDTHIWLWYAEGVTEKLSPASVKKLDAARSDGGLLISPISVWEVGVLLAKQRIQLSMPLRDWVDNALSAPGFRPLPLDAASAAESTLLPGEPQGDPADRFLIAAARIHGLTLATRDGGILEYAKSGAVRVLKM